MRNCPFPRVEASARSDALCELWLRAGVGPAWQTWRLPSHRRGAGANLKPQSSATPLCKRRALGSWRAGLGPLRASAHSEGGHQCPTRKRL